MSFFGVQLNAQVNKLTFEIRLQLARNKYVPNLRTIYRSFAGYDHQLSGKIQSFNFQKALNSNGIFFKKYQIQVFEKAFGENGLIDWFNFLSHLRQSMGPVRRQLVNDIFDNIDVQKKGKISTSDLMSHFNPNIIQTYKLGRKDLLTIKQQFLSLFHCVDGQISKQEFLNYYDDVNINFPHNEVFLRYVSQQWYYTIQKHQAVKEEQIKKVTKQLRFKLIEKTQASRDQYILKKIFNQYDLRQTSFIGPNQFDLMMKKLEINAQSQIVQQIHSRIDKNKSGYIEFDQFKKFLFHDPYPY